MDIPCNEDLRIGDKIRDALAAAGLRKVDLIKAGVGKSHQAINGWIKTGRITKSNLAALAEKTGLPLEWWHTPYSRARPAVEERLAARRKDEVQHTIGDARERLVAALDDMLISDRLKQQVLGMLDEHEELVLRIKQKIEDQHTGSERRTNNAMRVLPLTHRRNA